ncbi:MAG TPA: Hpt domain-containing protein, partial [Elusimicrobia bacterium]|nr:Hpt domain-containing protein [Elusimicrobiota bacterium]
LAARDLAALGAAGHKLVGAGGGYGFDRLTEIGRKLEDLSRAGDAQGLAGCLAELEDYLQNLEVVYE